MPRPSPLLPCRRAFPCSPPFIALRNAHPRYVVSSAGHRLVGAAGVSDLTGCGSFWRPPWTGVYGLVLSHLSTVEDAHAAVAAARYPQVPGGKTLRRRGSAVRSEEHT